MKNVSIWFQQKPIPQLSMFCLIQVINNYVQINTRDRAVDQQMKKKNGLLQTFFYDLLKIQVTNWVLEILVTFENQSSIIY
jgi:hypothetical protein